MCIILVPNREKLEEPNILSVLVKKQKRKSQEMVKIDVHLCTGALLPYAQRFTVTQIPLRLGNFYTHCPSLFSRLVSAF